MGANVEKEVKAILSDPENEKALRKAFKICDKDKSGALYVLFPPERLCSQVRDREEFHGFAKVVFDLDCKELKKEVVKEIKDEIGGMMGSMAASVAGKGIDIALEKFTTKEAIERFIEQLFAEGDKDNNGTLDFDEFKQLMKDHAEKKPEDRIDGFALDQV